jgi:ribosomal protein RSM22 (predicted rRNA methylase)
VVPSRITTLLDLGGGAAPALWAFGEACPGLTRARVVDIDPRLLALARDLHGTVGPHTRVSLETSTADLSQVSLLDAADLVVISYALGEIEARARQHLVDVAWAAARVALIVVEPGTSPGFERVRAARQQLVARGAVIAAPCPHDATCPIRGGDWCHFSARLERSRLHRVLKGGTLGYEDEKFSYVAAARPEAGGPAMERAAGRVIARPVLQSRRVRLRLCTAGGIQEPILTKSEGDAYREARHAAWGDPWNAR